MTIQSILTALVMSATIDLPEGTMICISESAAHEYLEAQQVNDENRLHWLSGSVCHALHTDFQDQTVLDADDQLIKIEWVYGRDRRVRFVIRSPQPVS